MTASEGGAPNPRRFGSWLRVLAVGRNPKRTLIRAAVLAVVCVVVFKFVVLPVRVSGISMTPACANGSFNFVNRLAYLWHEPRRGDVVAIRFTVPDRWFGPHIAYLKRIVALPGETISFVQGRAVINGQTLEEPYQKGPCDWNFAPEKVGPEEYFVIGDNRSMPQGEHDFGKVKRIRIVGKALR